MSGSERQPFRSLALTPRPQRIAYGGRESLIAALGCAMPEAGDQPGHPAVIRRLDRALAALGTAGAIKVVKTADTNQRAEYALMLDHAHHGPLRPKSTTFRVVQSPGVDHAEIHTGPRPG